MCASQRIDNLPRLCVLGINPHVGEAGLSGDGDERITRPAVQALQARGWAADGPLGADLALSERRHDAYVAMLHDRGHIAVKMLSPKGATALVGGCRCCSRAAAMGRRSTSPDRVAPTLQP